MATSANLKTLILDMIADLRENVLTTDDEDGDLLIIEFFFKRLHDDMIMEQAIKHILPHRKRIVGRETEFFKENKFLFAGLEDKKVDYYLKVFSDRKRFTIDDERTMFEYFDTILAILDAYKNK